jgi:hypothetical protein
MYSFKVFTILFILSICFVSSNEIYTRTQLRGSYQHNLNKVLNEEIRRIVEMVVSRAKNNGTSYYERYFIPTDTNENSYSLNTIILSKFSDKIIINLFKNILIDSNITISEPTCCSNYDGYICKIKFGVEICKFIYINW